jgi:hypothetical protein
MTTDNWIAFGGLILAFLVAGSSVFLVLITRIDDKDDGVREDFKTAINNAEATLGSMIGKSDLAFAQFKEQAEREYLRKGEYDIAQKNTERRLESIETKVDRIPESLEKQSERLIAAMRDTRQ